MRNELEYNSLQKEFATFVDRGPKALTPLIIVKFKGRA